MSSFHQRHLKKPAMKSMRMIYTKKMSRNATFDMVDMDELIYFLRLYFCDNDIYFFEAIKLQNSIKDIRLQFDVVNGNGDDVRLSKIEGIDFYKAVSSYSGLVSVPTPEDYKKISMIFLDRDLVNVTIDCIVEDVRYYFPIIPDDLSETRSMKVYIARLLVRQLRNTTTL